MPKKWFQYKEQGAGVKRLVFCWYTYKILGEKFLRMIVFFIVLFIFLGAKEQRKSSQKFYRIMGLNPILGYFKLFLNYGNSLVDKMISFAGNMSVDDFLFEEKEVFNKSFFITTHIGNAEILRTLLVLPEAKRANVFMQSNACETFNNFLKKLEIKTNIETFAVEDIDAETSMTIFDRLNSGEIVFMAGDRISAQNENAIYVKDFLGKKIALPIGTLKFALMMEVPINFIVCVKDGKKHRVFVEAFTPSSTKKNEKLEELKTAYVCFLEKYMKKYPYQSYNFYDIFVE